MNFQILLFYKYVHLKNPEKVMQEQRALCEKLGLLGRILIAEEGINATIEGEIESCEKYIEEMNKTKEFAGINYKKSKGTGDAFPKLSIKVRKEIVTTGVANLNPNKTTGKYITAEELHSWFSEKREFYIVDMRNDYEYAVGAFEGFIPSGMHRFYNLQDTLPRLAHLKNMTIVTVCTGGIRCEKASGFLVENGFNDVYQLKDGIVTYMEKYPNQHFKGKLYVFDKRIVMGFNTDSPEHEVIGRCMHCNKKSENFVNCHLDSCSYHYISCENCLDKDTGFAFCKDECRDKFNRGETKKYLATQSL